MFLIVAESFQKVLEFEARNYAAIFQKDGEKDKSKVLEKLELNAFFV